MDFFAGNSIKHGANGGIVMPQNPRYSSHDSQWGSRIVADSSEGFLSEAQPFRPFPVLSSSHVQYKDLTPQQSYSKCIPQSSDESMYKPPDSYPSFSGYQAQSSYPRYMVPTGYENGPRENRLDVRSNDGSSGQNYLDMWNPHALDGKRNMPALSEQHIRDYLSRYINGMSSYGPSDHRMDPQDQYKSYRPNSLNFYYDGPSQSISQASMLNKTNDVGHRNEIGNAYGQNPPSEAPPASQSYLKPLPEPPMLIPIENYATDSQTNADRYAAMNPVTSNPEPIMRRPDLPAYYNSHHSTSMYPPYTDVVTMAPRANMPPFETTVTSPSKDIYEPLRPAASYSPPNFQAQLMPAKDSLGEKHGDTGLCSDKNVDNSMNQRNQKDTTSADNNLQNSPASNSENASPKESEEVEIVPQFSHIPDWMVRWRRKAFKPKACGVCHKLARSSHFGGVCCDSCKAFFRRAVKSQTNTRFKCAYDGNCNVVGERRKACQACRFNKCLSIGMKPKWVVRDNSTDQQVATLNKKETTAFMLFRFNNCDSDDDMASIQGIVKAYEEARKCVKIPESADLVTSMLTFRAILTRFTKSISTVCSIHDSDWQVMFNVTWIGVFLLRLVHVYDFETDSFPHCKISLKDSPENDRSLAKMSKSEKDTWLGNILDITRKMYMEKIDCKTTLLLALIHMMDQQANQMLKSPELVAKMQEKLLDLLRKHLSMMHGARAATHFYPLLLTRLADFREYQDQIACTVTEFL